MRSQESVMIEQVLNRDFVSEQMRVLTGELRAQIVRLRRGSEHPPEHLSIDAYEEAGAELDSAVQRETQGSSGPTGYEPPPSGRRGKPAPPIDERAFFSRDPVVNIVQSALDEFFEEQDSSQLQSRIRRGGRRATQPWVAVTDRSLKVAAPKRGHGRRIFEKFSISDIGWVNSKIAEGIRSFRNKAPFNPQPADPIPIDNKARLVIVGDWGSGVPRARKVGLQMRSIIEQGIAERVEQHVIHLGDVYYSGWRREYQQRFLNYWPVRVEEAKTIRSWSLNGNHDMYSGGQDYFGVLLTDLRFAAHQGSSFFSLRNDAWEIMGLDTAWEDADLKVPQPSWVASCLEASSRKIMLLSHHQPFSAFEKCGNKLGVRLGGPLASGRVRAWLWGHEHRCAAYDPYHGIASGRCLGHGGVPVYQWHKQASPYPPPTRYEFRDFVTTGLVERWALFGFAVLDFNGDQAHIRYIDEDGTEHYHEDIA